MHDETGQMADPRHIFQQLIRSKETLMFEVMTFEASDTQCRMRIAEMIDHVLIRQQGNRGPLQMDQALAAPMRTISFSLVNRR